MKTLDHIPTSKIQRATKLLKVGAQVGLNYVKYVGDQIVNDKESAKTRLDEANATDIYNGLSELKGSALKMAQMLSMDQGILPEAYVEKFSLAQFNVPPLSGPLTRKVIQKEFNEPLDKLFDTFNLESSYAASIGQVHEASYKNQRCAVKVQYPGVANSVSSDLQLIKPFALKMFQLKEDEVEDYFLEIEKKLKEETNYLLESKQLQAISNESKAIDNVVFPKVITERTSEKVLTMEWMNGLHLSEYVQSEVSIEKRKEVAQTLWDFYLFQIHGLQKVHADPHPGNFKVNEENKLVCLDFGCMKKIPNSFYKPYFELTKQENIDDTKKLTKLLMKLEVIFESDSKKERKVIIKSFREMLTILNQPFQYESFDFSSPEYFKKLLKLGAGLKDNTELRSIGGKRGSKHFLYINRTLFGLLGLMHSLDAGEIEVNRYKKYL